jgi:hypothetical protein
MQVVGENWCSLFKYIIYLGQKKDTTDVMVSLFDFGYKIFIGV